MPSDQFNDLMHIWASIENKDPPFASIDHLHHLIDSIPEGELPWHGLSIKHVDAERLQDNPNTPSWKLAEYDFWFRDAKEVIKRQLSNPAFKDHFDYAPKQIFGEQHQRVWSNFMTGNWAWKQCVSKFCMLRAFNCCADSSHNVRISFLTVTQTVMVPCLYQLFLEVIRLLFLWQQATLNIIPFIFPMEISITLCAEDILMV